jgi:hypothetical protein
MEELFQKHWQSIKTPCSLDLNRDGFLMSPSYPIRNTAEVIDIIQKVEQKNFACFDVKKQKPLKLTEHSWASLLVAGLAHNWRKTGTIDCSKSGVITLVNLRPWVDKSLDARCVGNCYSRVLPHGGSFNLDETLEAVTSRLRVSMGKQLNDLEQLKVLKKPLDEVVGAPFMLSNPGPARMPGFIVDGLLQEIVQNVNPEDSSEWAFLFTYSAWSSGDRPQMAALISHGNKVVISEEDVIACQKLTVKGVLTITLDLTVREALKKLCPAIKTVL